MAIPAYEVKLYFDAPGSYSCVWNFDSEGDCWLYDDGIGLVFFCGAVAGSTRVGVGR